MTKRQTQFLENEQELVLRFCKKVKEGHTKVKVGHKKIKAGHDSKRKPYKTSNTEYNDIQDMLNDNNVSNEYTYKKLVEIKKIYEYCRRSCL